MIRGPWCGACQDHEEDDRFPHYAGDEDEHQIGDEYGPTGAVLLDRRVTIEALDAALGRLAPCSWCTYGEPPCSCDEIALVRAALARLRP